MRLIRLSRMRVISLTQGEHWQGADWVPDTAENRQQYEELLRQGYRSSARARTGWKNAAPKYPPIRVASS